MSQFIELIFKHHLLQLHPLLIYKNPFAPKLDKTKTITFWDSINFISNETGEIDPKSDFRKDLEWLKRLRNDIEHYKFVMDVPKVRETLGRTFRSVLEFIEHFSEVEIEDHISKDASDMFQVLSDEYEHKLHNAIKEADDAEKDVYIGISPKEYIHVQWERYDCPECGNHTMIPNGESSTGIRCTFCKNEETRERLILCDCCGADFEEDEMDVWPMDDGSIQHRCYYCSGRYYAEKDD